MGVAIVRSQGIDRRITWDWKGEFWGSIGHGLGDALHWTGVSKAGNASWERPSWLPVALLCCEADGDIGPGFASAILDAGAGNPDPALIACDWLEEMGIEGALAWNLEGEVPKIIRCAPPDDWMIHRDCIAIGPLHSWCRRLLEDRCAACGGHLDGEDAISYLWPAGGPDLEPTGREGTPSSLPANYRAETARRIAKAIREVEEKFGTYRQFLIPADCPGCDLPRHPGPPPVMVPSIIRAGPS